MSKNLNPLYTIEEGMVVNAAKKALNPIENSAAKQAALKGLATKGSNVRNQLAHEIKWGKNLSNSYARQYGLKALPTKREIPNAVKSAVTGPIQGATGGGSILKRIGNMDYLNNVKGAMPR
jgi:hypothetical protein